MKLTYDDTRRTCYMGFVTQAVSVNFPPLLFLIFQTEFGLSYEEVGRLILVNFGTQIFADVVCTKYADKLGHRFSGLCAFALSFIGLILLGTLPRVMTNTYLSLILSVIVFSWGSGFIEVLISPVIDALPARDKSTGLSFSHAFYCWGQMGVVIVTTLLLKFLGSGLWPYLAYLWALVPLGTMLFYAKVPIVPPLSEDKKTPLKNLFAAPSFWAGMLMMICAGSAELTMSQWSSLFAEKGLGVSKVMGDLLGPCLFALGMGVCRTIYGVWGAKIKLSKALIFCAGLTCACYAVAVFANVPILSLLGCAMCGFAVGMLWPGTLSNVTSRYPMGGTAMFGVLAVCGDIGGSVGPWLAGLVSDLAQGSGTLMTLAAKNGLTPDQLGLKSGLCVAMLFPLTLLIVLLIKNRKSA